jgi:hypothetical protein
MTHSSASPNYRILASVDIGRRQAELEGCELVQKQAELAARVASGGIEKHPLLQSTSGSCLRSVDAAARVMLSSPRNRCGQQFARPP